MSVNLAKTWPMIYNQSQKKIYVNLQLELRAEINYEHYNSKR